MSVKRRDLIRYFEKNGFYLLREGGKHTIYTNDKKVIPVMDLSPVFHVCSLFFSRYDSIDISHIIYFYFIEAS